MRPVTDLQRTVAPFEVISDYTPSGDQPTAIADLTKRIQAGEKDVVLLGATGTGKSATTAWLIELLPNNAVEYFVSYYDYYQPEAYIAQTDTYIEKDSSINDEVERLRHSATSSLLTRRDVVVVASVSCIYGLGTPQEYVDRMVRLAVGDSIERDQLLRRFVAMQYTRNDMAFTRGTFRVRGDTVEIIPVYEELAIRIEFFGDEIEAIQTLHPLTGDVLRSERDTFIFPATHYVAGPERMERAIGSIESELAGRLDELERHSKLLEAQRLRMRTTYDIEMMRQIGSCSGIENYSRHIDGRAAGTAPHTLLDYFPEDFLLVIDESHVTVPQIGAMYEGDMSRKRNLVDHGFRLPSAMDNRPLRWEEFVERVGQTVYLSATPGSYELSMADGTVEQLIRPTGLVDPEVVVKPTSGQIDDLLEEIRLRAERNERVLVTTLTKKMSEDLTDDRPGGPERVRAGAHVRGPDHAVDGARDRGDRSSPGEAGGPQPGPQHRPDPVAQEDRGHHRHARPGGRGHRGAARGRVPAVVPGEGAHAGPRCGYRRRTAGAAGGRGRRRAGRADPGAQRPDARGRRRAPVRAGRPAAGRDLRAQAGAAPDAGGHGLTRSGSGRDVCIRRADPDQNRGVRSTRGRRPGSRPGSRGRR